MGKKNGLDQRNGQGDDLLGTVVATDGDRRGRPGESGLPEANDAGDRERDSRRRAASDRNRPPIPAVQTIDDLAKESLDGRTARPVDPHSEERFPNLWELLTVDAYRDGCLRHLPTIRIVRAQGGYQATFQDHETCYQWTVTYERLEDTWKALERRIATGGPGVQFKSMINKTGQPFSRRKKKT